MTAKLMMILLGLGLTSLTLLVHRQQRIDTAFEMTRIHDRCDQVRTSLWDVRCTIAQHIARLEPVDQPEVDPASKQHVVRTLPDQLDTFHGG